MLISAGAPVASLNKAGKAPLDLADGPTKRYLDSASCLRGERFAQASSASAAKAAARSVSPPKADSPSTKAARAPPPDTEASPRRTTWPRADRSALIVEAFGKHDDVLPPQTPAWSRRMMNALPEHYLQPSALALDTAIYRTRVHSLGPSHENPRRTTPCRACVSSCGPVRELVSASALVTACARATRRGSLSSCAVDKKTMMAAAPTTT